jgi:hypothetical protein
MWFWFTFSLWPGTLSISSLLFGHLDFFLWKSSVQFTYPFFHWLIEFFGRFVFWAPCVFWFKINFLGCKKIISDGSIELQEVIKNTRIGKYMWQYKQVITARNNCNVLWDLWHAEVKKYVSKFKDIKLITYAVKFLHCSVKITKVICRKMRDSYWVSE